MKSLTKLLLATLFVAPAAMATKVPLPVEGATMNVSFQLQTQALMNENGTPDGKNTSFDVYVRRSRVLINGDINQNFSYLVQLDNPNFGKFGNFTGRALIQDAWIGWAPTGITGPNVLYVDAGLLLIPISHHLLESTTNFVSADNHGDVFRLGGAYPNARNTGIQLRGWALDKKIGFRGGVYEGIQPINTSGTGCSAPAAGNPPACLNAKRSPQLAGFVNVDLIGSEEGGWLYGAYKWGKAPIVAIGGSGIYQSGAVFDRSGNFADQKFASAHVYVNLPMTEANELVAEVVGYRSDNGIGSGNTGKGFSADLGYRFGFVAPYASYEYFQSDDCDASLTAAQCTSGGAGQSGSADSRNFRAGLNFFINKNQNHVNVEFAANHGQSGYGNTAITTASAGYAPQGVSANLRAPANKSLLLHWNVQF